MKSMLTLFLAFLMNVSFAQNFEIYISDAGNFNKPPWQILKFDQDGQNPEVFIDSELNWPQDILFFEDSNFVLISNLGTGKITKYDINSGIYIGDFATSIGGPTRIKVGPDGLLYVLQWTGNNKVKRYNLNGTYVDDFTSVGVTQSIGVDWDLAGNLYVSSYNGDKVQKFDANGQDLGVFINSDLAGPTNIWFDENGDLLVSDYDGTAVKRFDSKGVFKEEFLTGLNKSEGVDFFPNGDILIGNGSTKSVKLFSKDGVYQKDLIPTGSGNLITPNGVTLRKISTSSIKENIDNKPTVIYPTEGLEFFVKDDYLKSINKLEVHDMLGKLIYSADTISNPIWNASDSKSGIYIVSIYSFSGKMQSTQVSVKSR